MVERGEPVPKGGGVYRVGAPYVVAGQTYVPEDNPHYRAEGLASWYGDDFHGRADRQRRDFRPQRHLGRASDAAAAELCAGDQSRQRPLADRARQRSRALSRQPHHRRVDEGGAALGFHDRGTARVRVEYVGRAPMEGSDDRMLEATLAAERAGAGCRAASGSPARPSFRPRIRRPPVRNPPRFASASASATHATHAGAGADDVVCATA